MWRFRGTPYYLARQAERLGVPPDMVHASRHNAEIFKLATLVSQLCEHWHRAPKDGGNPSFYAPDLKNFRDTLMRGENEVKKLHILAAAADEMQAEAWAAFGLERPRQNFYILEDLPPLTLPLGDGTVGITDDELEPTLSESG